MKANSEIATLVNAVEMGIKRDKETESLLHIVKMCREANEKKDAYYFEIGLNKDAIIIKIYEIRKCTDLFQQTVFFGKSPSDVEALEKKIKGIIG